MLFLNPLRSPLVLRRARPTLIVCALLAFLLSPVAGLAAKPRAMVFPLLSGEDVNGFEYQQLNSAFYLGLSELEEFELITTFELFSLMHSEELEPSDLQTPEARYAFARRHNVDILIYGGIESFETETVRDLEIRRIGVDLRIASVARQEEFNRVLWSAVVLGESEESAQMLTGLSRLAAVKLLWKRPDVYPVELDYNPEGVSVSLERRKALRERVRSMLAEVQLPSGVEIDRVQVRLREATGTPATAVLGCVTVVGMFILPMTEVETVAEVRVSVKRLSETGGLQIEEFAAVESAEDSFSIWKPREAARGEVTERALDRATEESVRDLRRQSDLFRSRGALLREYLNPAPRPERLQND